MRLPPFPSAGRHVPRRFMVAVVALVLTGALVGDITSSGDAAATVASVADGAGSSRTDRAVPALRAREVAPLPDHLAPATAPDSADPATIVRGPDTTPAPDGRAVAFAAYRDAAAEWPSMGCTGRWQILAAIGHAESGHGLGDNAPAVILLDGTVTPGVLGPRLDGGGFAVVRDTDGGALDGEQEYDRAVGPMQFMPATWERHQRDGNDDGVADPQNLHDAALAAAQYLCVARRGALDDPANLDGALRSYNNSEEYVQKVLGLVAAYDSGALAAG